MFYSVDAIENGVARLCADDESILFAKIDKLPTQIKENDVVEKIGEVFVLKSEETAKRMQNIKNKLDILLNRN